MTINGLFKPEYFFQSNKLIKRLTNNFSPQSPITNSEFIDELLPWGLRIRVRPSEEHGKILIGLGVIDLPITEILFRLIDAEEVAVDVGANIGYMTSILASKIGNKGKVYAFEAHPEIFEELRFNVQNWLQTDNISNIQINHVALSDSQGEVELFIPLDFQSNRGLASVQMGKGDENYQSITVSSITLDDEFSNQRIGVLKLDVEGYELNVLKGAKKLLQDQRIRDCIFEEHNNYPTKTTDFLEEMGYTIFRVQRQFLGLNLIDPNSSIPRIPWLPTNFLATIEPQRAKDRCKARGWRCLKKINIKKENISDE